MVQRQRRWPRWRHGARGGLCASNKSVEDLTIEVGARTTSSAFSNFPAHLFEARKLRGARTTAVLRRRRFCDFVPITRSESVPRVSLAYHSAIQLFHISEPTSVTLYLSNSGVHIRHDDLERKLDACEKKIPSSCRDAKSRCEASI